MRKSSRLNSVIWTLVRWRTAASKGFSWEPASYEVIGLLFDDRGLWIISKFYWNNKGDRFYFWLLISILFSSLTAFRLHFYSAYITLLVFVDLSRMSWGDLKQLAFAPCIDSLKRGIAGERDALRLGRGGECIIIFINKIKVILIYIHIFLNSPKNICSFRIK